MKITNKWGLPEPLVRAVSFSEYKRGLCDYTVTELIKPPRIAALERIHADELEEDASDRLWALMGSAGHEVLRRAADSGIVEKRLAFHAGGKNISGQLDYIEPLKEIIDYKFTSVWAVKEGVKEEWEMQLNCYKWLCDNNEVPVKEMKIVAILRDWSKPEASRDSSYPQCQVVVLPVNMWSKEAVQLWIEAHIIMHERARSGQLPECRPEQTWERPTTYAAMKKGNQRASRVLPNLVEAGTWIASQPSPTQFSIETRPGERPRCEHYCSVSEFCEQFKQWKEQQCK